jgi:hypothetical protein
VQARRRQACTRSSSSWDVLLFDVRAASSDKRPLILSADETPSRRRDSPHVARAYQIDMARARVDISPANPHAFDPHSAVVARASARMDARW